MSDQYTPTFHRMWNREFIMLVIAELLLCVSCYMTIPILPYRLANNNTSAVWLACIAMVIFIVGICISGLFGSWLIQKFRRNKVFIISSLLLSATIFTMSIVDRAEIEEQQLTSIFVLLYLFCGMVFGNAKRVLSCTLLIDKTESCHRTEANYTAIWISRLAIVVGPTIGMLLNLESKDSVIFTAGSVATLISCGMVMCVKFPFRAPDEDVNILSIDRFFLPKGWNIAIVVMLMAASLGIILSARLTLDFCLSLICGFILAISILRYAIIRKGRYTSAVGNIIMIASLLSLTLNNGLLDDTLKPMILGMGFGMTSSEQLYKLLDRCDHCQRSTAESTYFLASDGGLFLGIAAGWMIQSTTEYAEHTALLLVLLASAICSVNSLHKQKQASYRA